MKIFKYIEFVNEATTAVPQIIKDFVNFLVESPCVTMYPEDEGDKIRQGWLSKECKMYSLPGIKKYFKNKYGESYSSLNVDNAIMYDPNIKILSKLLAGKGLTLQTTPIKSQFGDTSWFYSVNLTDDEIQSIKKSYEDEFVSRYDKYYKKKAAVKATSLKAAAVKVSKKASKRVPSKRAKKPGTKNEAVDMLIECLLTLK